MSIPGALRREVRFSSRDPVLWLWLALVLGLSAMSVAFGLAEVERQNETIQKLIDGDRHDRLAQYDKQESWGSAAYYSFHLTYDPPSDFAYAAMGQRDAQPWMHRIRMLALEGQIHERDVANPSIALIGRFDFAFLAAFVIPLVLILLLYDLRARERIAGRHDWLEATVGQPTSFWLLRASLRAGAVFVTLVVPVIIGGMVAGASPAKWFVATLGVFAYVALWTMACFFVSSWRRPGSVIMLALIAIWVAIAVIVPAGARLAIDRLVPIPTGADILLLQRETVNDAWDLPREVTMAAFFERHPEWSEYQPVEGSFEWQWYYAFQQVGDQRTEQLSTAYRDGRLRRDHMAAWVSILALPSLLERFLQSLADTDLRAFFEYEEGVRGYHAALRDFYYPKFFRNEAFDRTLLEDLPSFKPGNPGMG